MVDVLGEFHSVDGHFNIHVALHLAAPSGVDEFLTT